MGRAVSLSAGALFAPLTATADPVEQPVNTRRSRVTFFPLQAQTVDRTVESAVALLEHKCASLCGTVHRRHSIRATDYDVRGSNGQRRVETDFSFVQQQCLTRLGA